MEQELKQMLCDSYQRYLSFHLQQSLTLLRLNSFLLSSFAERPAVYVSAVLCIPRILPIPASPLAKRPKGTQYVPTRVNIRPEEHEDLRFLPFSEVSGKVMLLPKLNEFYSRTPFNESSHSEQIIGNRQLSDYLMLDLLRLNPEFSVQVVAKLLGKSANLIQELRSDVRLNYLHPVVFSETVVKSLESKFCRTCKTISCFLHFPCTTKTVLEDPFSGPAEKVEDKGRALLQKVDPKGWKNAWFQWKCSSEGSGQWLRAHRCSSRSSCWKYSEVVFVPGQVEKWIAKILLQKGVANPCILAEFACISCPQAASITHSLKQHPPRPLRLEDLGTTFPAGDSTQYPAEITNSKEPSTCSCAVCTPDVCPCLDGRPESRKICEKFCECVQCERRFLGCNCKYGGCTSNTCVCYANQRECDPDICLSCCAGVLAHSVHAKQVTTKGKKESWVVCLNTVIQSCRHKRTAIAQSAISAAGFGLYALEDIKSDEFITEYTGELISDPEALRRGIMYDSQEHSYIFSLTAEESLDAMLAGNKMRFANHRSGGEENCYGKTLRVMGNTCVALYAKQDIAKGTELFFDYQYQKGDVKYAWFISYIKELEERKKGKKKGKA